MSEIQSKRSASLLFVVFVVSFAALSFQITLTRVFSIAQWHHFAHMIISVAMLGFAAAGTLISLLHKKIRHPRAWIRFASPGAAVSFPLAYLVFTALPFETYQITTQPVQVLYLGLLYLSLAAPFGLASAVITLAFIDESESIGLVYFSNMTGSGAGALFTALGLYYIPVAWLPYLLFFLTAAGTLVLARNRLELLGLGGLILAGLALTWSGGVRPVNISQYKALNYGLQKSDAQVVGRDYSPLSRVTAVHSNLIRKTPGQISNYPHEKYGRLPEQVVLYYDGGAPSTIPRFTGDLDRIAYLDYTTGALPYHLPGETKETAVIGAGGGSQVLLALYNEARSVDAVEVEPVVHRFLREDLSRFSGNLYHRDGVNYQLAEGRGFLRATGRDYDLVQFPLIDSFSAASSGANTLAESYLYTREAFRLYLNRLDRDGLIGITRWLRSPPRDFIKIIATAVEALEAEGVESPGRHLLAVRSWNTATLLVSASPLTEADVKAATEFAESRQFDLVHTPGLERGKANRYVLLDSPVYYDAVQKILSPEREQFYRNYPFVIRPASDDQPYFYHFFRWSGFARLWNQTGSPSLRFMEWGYVILILTLIQATVASLGLILLPLWLVGDLKLFSRRCWLVLIYFGGLGLAYMFLEMVLIQRLMLFLTYPVYSIAVVLAALLGFSGGGSLLAHKFRDSPVLAATAGVAVVAGSLLIYQHLFPVIFNYGGHWPDYVKIPVALALLAPPATAMGLPFPVGLQRAAKTSRELIPWAWAVNGSLSVVGAGLATLLSVHLGFAAVTFLAVSIYILVLPALPRFS